MSNGNVLLSYLHLLRSPKFYKVSPKLVKGITAAWNEEWKNSRAKKTTTDFNL